jgi:general secretion pathway protein I
MGAEKTRRGRRPAGRAAGFTLLEVVIALVIAGLALAVLFGAGSTGLYGTVNARRAEEAVERAQSHLAAVGSDPASIAGRSAGDDGGGFHWRLSVRPLASQQTLLAGGRSLATRSLYDVEVAISWKAGGKTRRVVLVTRRLGTALTQR